jgi:hypothetical protein
MNMSVVSRVLVGLGLSLVVVAPAVADLALVGRSTVLAMGMQGVGKEGVWLRKTDLRRDLVDRGKAYTHLYDLATREITIIDHSQRLAQVYAMTNLREQSGARASTSDLQLKITATGRHKPLKSWNCAEHKLEVAMPAQIGDEKVSFEMTGEVWLARNTPEQKETAAFVKAAENPDFFMGIPALAKSSPAQARGISEVVRRLAPLGLLCSVDVETRYQGSGRMAELSRKMNSRISVQYENFSTQALPENLFGIPQGYRVTRQ